MARPPVSWPDWLRFRPIVAWPGEQTAYREHSRFKAAWSETVRLLERELELLRAKNVVLQVALAESQLRLDGKPRSGVRAEHPGVILAFESKYGPLQYLTDRYPTWEENLRAIALSLEALRKVDRYGVSKRGEQYTGWKQLGAGPTMSQLEAAEYLINLAAGPFLRIEPQQLITDAEIRRSVYRAAARRSHPDTGGSPELWDALSKAKASLPA